MRACDRIPQVRVPVDTPVPTAPNTGELVKPCCARTGYDPCHSRLFGSLKWHIEGNQPGPVRRFQRDNILDLRGQRDDRFE